MVRTMAMAILHRGRRTVRKREMASSPAIGLRANTYSEIVSQRGTRDSPYDAAVETNTTTTKAVISFWLWAGCGGTSSAEERGLFRWPTTGGVLPSGEFVAVMAKRFRFPEGGGYSSASAKGLRTQRPV